MLLTNDQSNIIYDRLYDWLAVHTPGNHRGMSTLIRYQKEVWAPVANVINILSGKTVLSNEEQDFLKLVTYNGIIYRIQNYNPRERGYIFESSNYQSWSRNIEGISKVSNICGLVLLIVGTACNGIDVFGLLHFLIKHQYITIPIQNEYKKPSNLLRYEEEQEVAYPVMLKCINEIVAVEKDKLEDWLCPNMNIPRCKWKKNTFR